MPRPTPEEIEKLIDRTLRDLPARRAPRSLESRVLAAIAAQQELSWWRQSFAHWPLAARGAFLVVTAVLAAAVIALCFHTSGEVQTASLLAGPLALWGKITAIVGGVGNLGAVVLRSIPAVWLYGGLAFVAMMYVALFGLGAAAYRSLFVQR